MQTREHGEQDSQHEKLLHQFNRPESVKVGDADGLTVHLSPEQKKTEIPTFVLGGFSATPDALKDALIRTAEAGREVFSPHAPHGVKTEERSGMAMAMTRKLQVLFGSMDAKGINKTNVIAHSSAAVYAAAAAAANPERFENIVLVEPAGLIGQDSLLKLLGRTIQDMKGTGEAAKGLKPVAYQSDLSVGAKSILSNLYRSYRELEAIAGSDITDSLKKAHDAGVGISIIHAVDDEVFPMQRVIEMTKAHMLDGFYSVRGPHGSIYLFQPFGEAAEAALTALEKKRESRTARVPVT